MTEYLLRPVKYKRLCHQSDFFCEICEKDIDPSRVSPGGWHPGIFISKEDCAGTALLCEKCIEDIYESSMHGVSPSGLPINENIAYCSRCNRWVDGGGAVNSEYVGQTLCSSCFDFVSDTRGYRRWVSDNSD